MLTSACAGLFLDPGLGKTSISLAAMKVLKKEKLVSKVLIIAPLRVCYSVWPREIEKWRDFEDLTYTILHGKDKQRNLNKEVDIYLVNPEGLMWLLKQNFKKLNFDMLIIDESSKFKTWNSQRMKLLRTVLHLFRRRYILTGTPAPNGLMDIFSQIFILDGGAALGKFVTQYRQNYFYPSGFGGYEWKLQPGGEKRIQERIKPLTLRLSAEDHLELPERVINPIYIDLPDDARAVYEDLEKELYTDLLNGELAASNAAVASMKCCQIANGGVYDEDGFAHLVHMQKAEFIADLVDELQGTPVLVAYEFGHDLDRLRKVLGKDVPYIGGGVSTKRSTMLEKAWNSGELPVLLGQPASIGHGLNLQDAGNHVAWHSLTWNYEYYDQFIRRVLRQGSKHKKVFVHHIIARDTVDEAKIWSLRAKGNTQDSFFKGLNTYLSSKRKKL